MNDTVAKRRGRPPKKYQEPVETRAVEEKKQRRRRRRDDSGGGMRLHIPLNARDPNCEHRWINDTAGGRMQQKTKFDDWDIVTIGEVEMWAAKSRGETYNSHKDTGAGEKVTRIVGVDRDNTGLRAFWCKKPKEFVQEDYQQAQGIIAEQEASMTQAPPTSDQGITAKEGGYVAEGNKIGRL